MQGTVVITGANRGLGLSQSKMLLENGYQVICINRNENSDVKRLENQYKELLTIYQGDVTDEPAIEEIAKDIAQNVPYIDILINNAAVHTSQSSNLPDIDELSIQDMQNDLMVNSIGPLIVIKHLLPLVRKGNKKLIVNISSEAGSIGNSSRKREFGYCMSKAALNMASKILQNRLKNEKIKILAIHPGWFSSDMGGKMAPITPDEAAKNVIHIILHDWKLNDPIYIDAKTGSQIEW